MSSLPISIPDVEHLEELLSEPTPGVIETMKRLEGDLMVLGVGGKMGPSLARMAKRASDAAGVPRRVIGVARFTSSVAEKDLHRHGIETIACDLLESDQVQRLPDAANVVFMVGFKFGSSGDERTTWAVNAFLPGVISRKFRCSRIVAFSTGNVYGLFPVTASPLPFQGGSVETDPPQPVGEYALSCLGRERVFKHFSRRFGIPLSLIRLNYACDLRYGVLVDIARMVLEERPVPLAMGYFNTIWQGDANAMSLQAFAHVAAPPFVANVTGPERLSVRGVAQQFGALFGRPVRFEGEESADALLSNAGRAMGLFGPSRVPARQLIHWTADWFKRGGAQLDKPTHFEVRHGNF